MQLLLITLASCALCSLHKSLTKRIASKQQPVTLRDVNEAEGEKGRVELFKRLDLDTITFDHFLDKGLLQPDGRLTLQMVCSIEDYLRARAKELAVAKCVEASKPKPKSKEGKSKKQSPRPIDPLCANSEAQLYQLYAEFMTFLEKIRTDSKLRATLYDEKGFQMHFDTVCERSIAGRIQTGSKYIDPIVNDPIPTAVLTLELHESAE
jgi:hypothetical protein